MEINSFLLILGFIFTFFIPGFLIVQTFFYELPSIQKLPLYLLLSILVSTYTVYVVSLVIGYSRYSILLCESAFFIWSILFLVKKNFRIKIDSKAIKEHWSALFVALVIFALFLGALYPAIFTEYQNYFVMSSVNWQDTAMHQSIIENISQGNFPPQAPYFSGQTLSYYYFTDFHSAILETLFGQFFPRILVYDNPFFVMTFFLSVYALSYFLFKNKIGGIISGLLATFCSNFLYYRFFQDVLNNLSRQTNILTSVKDLITSSVGSYTFDYGQLMQMPPLANYFLQNRPMMVGLPAVVLFILLLMHGFDTNKNKYFILASLLTGMLIKFQLFAFGINIIIFLFSILIFKKRNFKETLRKSVYFFGPLFIFMIFASLLFKNSGYLVEIFLSNIRLGPWDKTKDFLWYLVFPFANFGVPFSLFLAFIVLIILKKISPTNKTMFILMLTTVLFLIPNVISFTIYEADMLKFYYFLMIPLSLISGFIIQRFITVPYFGKLFIIILIVISSFGSYLTLGWSYFNKNEAYSQAEYKAGMWIRTKTLPNAIFMTLPTVHSAVSDIGGRLRLLSYINWPHSHGFNTGADNVFTRQADIESVYRNPLNIENAREIFLRYHVNYIYVSKEEKNAFPSAQTIFDRQNYLKLVYDQSGIKVYKVI